MFFAWPRHQAKAKADALDKANSGLTAARAAAGKLTAELECKLTQALGERDALQGRIAVYESTLSEAVDMIEAKHNALSAAMASNDALTADCAALRRDLVAVGSAATRAVLAAR